MKPHQKYTCNERRQGTTTAGDTAASTKPSMKPHCQGKPNMRWLATATTRVSARHGEKASLNTMADSFFRATGSNPSPNKNRNPNQLLSRREKNTKLYASKLDNHFKLNLFIY
jgi:hypothetical protein